VLNTSKTKIIKYCLRNDTNITEQPHWNVKIHDESCSGTNLSSCDCPTIEHVTSVRYLGVMIDKNFSWKIHIQRTVNKVRFGLFILKKMAFVASSQFLKRLYYAFIQSHLQYCLSVYGGTFWGILQPLFVIQKRAIRIICKVNNREHTENLFKMLNILPLNKLIIYRTILYYNKNPTFVQLSTGRSVRQSNYIQFLCKTTRGQHQLSVSVLSSYLAS